MANFGNQLLDFFGMGGSKGLADAIPTVATQLGSYASDPSLSPLKDAVSNFTSSYKPMAFTPTQYSTGSYTAKDMSSAALPQFDAMRNRINTQYSQTQGQAQDALDRQFAAMGGGPGSGVQAKQTENLASGIAQQKGRDLEGINSQEAQARQDLQTQENQKEFQSGEAAKGRAFQGELQNANQGFQANQFNQQMGTQVGEFGLGEADKITGMDEAYKEAQAQNEQAAAAQNFNSQLSYYQARHSGGLFGGGGFLGLGIGA